ncbi:hypothetical protein GALMADRAFT_159896 [Galerina marginata CBS 339.88]|uniref:BTB domain-containing protein n=1 Tax=Galerina marginata (strain CBS 339.88) TaxID=685588 RepID=A0A067SHM8_GALM3|nr:hypothetical protein GALMADRAFT_159896 [Galerina marginata CBS 339.88]
MTHDNDGGGSDSFPVGWLGQDSRERLSVINITAADSTHASPASWPIAQLIAECTAFVINTRLGIRAVLACFNAIMVVPAQNAMIPWLDSAIKTATRALQKDLESLFFDAQNQFPDIVWDTEAVTPDDWKLNVRGQVWGHKAIIIARGVPTFYERYLIQPTDPKSNRNIEESVTPSSGPIIAHPKPSCNQALLSLDLRQLYTVEGLQHGLKDENKFQTTSSEEQHLDNFQKDLLSMWKTQLYSDVRIAISGLSDDPGQEFLSHRFLLSSRSPYFRRVLRPDSNEQKITSQAEPVSIAFIDLPCTHFTTPAALQFILGYLYTGTLRFAEEYDLGTAFSIFRGSLYLELPVLQQLILAEITVEKLHGLYHAYLSDLYFSELVGGKWSNIVKLGCECTPCATCIPLVLLFAQEDGIKNDILERGARRGLVEIMIDAILTDIQGFMTPPNVIPLIFAAESALLELGDAEKSWEQAVKSIVLSVRESIDEVLCRNAETCFKLNMWRNLLVDDKIVDISQKQASYQRVTWVLAAVSRVANQQNASDLHKALVGSTYSYMHTPYAFAIDDFSFRAQIEQTQVELLSMMELSISTIPAFGKLNNILLRIVDAKNSIITRRTAENWPGCNSRLTVYLIVLARIIADGLNGLWNILYSESVFPRVDLALNKVGRKAAQWGFV